MTVAHATPDWLIEPEVGLCPCGCIGRRRKGDFVEKTIVGGAGLMRRTMFSDDISTQAGLLQRVDPRVKIVSLFGLLLSAAIIRNATVLVGVYLLTLVLAKLSGVSLKFYVARVWLFVPIFTGIIVVPATLSFITPGHIVVPLGSWFGSPVGLTQQGLTGAALIVMRVATSISIAVLLTLSTPWPRLLSALGSLRVPRVFILVTGMAYRYLFYLLGSVIEMYTARQARTVERETSVRAGRTFVAASAGALFGKTYALSEEIHMAMVSRGYTAGRPSRSRTPIPTADWMFLGTAVLVAAVTIGVDRAVGH